MLTLLPPDDKRLAPIPFDALNLPDLHAGHRAMLARFRKFNVWAAARGYRKSTQGCHYALNSIRQNRLFWWGAPEEQNLNNVIDDTWQYIMGRENWDKYYRRGDRTLRVPGWGILQFIPLNNSRGGHGGTPNDIFIDEMGLLKTGVYDEIIKPILSKTRDSTFLGVGTPNPDNPINDFWEMCTRDMTLPENQRWSCGIIPLLNAKVNQDGDLERLPASPFDAPHWNFEDLQQEWQETPLSKRNMWRIQMLCEFIEADGDGFENVGEACCINNLDKGDKWVNQNDCEYFKAGMKGAAALGWYQYGADVAVTPTGDWTVIIVIDRKTMEQVYFRRMRPKANTKEGRHAQVHEALIRAWKLFPCVANVDYTGVGDGVVEAMWAGGCSRTSVVGFHFGGTAQKKLNLVSHLQALLEDSQVKFFNLPVIVRELKGMKRTEKDGKVKYEAANLSEDKEKLHDDIPIAAALAVMGITPPKISALDANIQHLPPQINEVAGMLW